MSRISFGVCLLAFGLGGAFSLMLPGFCAQHALYPGWSITDHGGDADVKAYMIAGGFALMAIGFVLVITPSGFGRGTSRTDVGLWVVLFVLGGVSATLATMPLMPLEPKAALVTSLYVIAGAIVGGFTCIGCSR